MDPADIDKVGEAGSEQVGMNDQKSGVGGLAGNRFGCRMGTG